MYVSNSHGSLNRRLPEMVNHIHGIDSVTDTSKSVSPYVLKTHLINADNGKPRILTYKS